MVATERVISAITVEQLRCPCGRGAVTYSDSSKYILKCEDCHRRTSLFDTEEDAIQAWNAMVERLNILHRAVQSITISKAAPDGEGPTGWSAETDVVRVLTDGSTVARRYGGWGPTIDKAYADLRKAIAEREEGWSW